MTSRVMALGLLWLVLITSATYTANLAAVLTRKNYIIEGPKTLDDLNKWFVCLFPFLFWNEFSAYMYIFSFILHIYTYACVCACACEYVHTQKHTHTYTQKKDTGT